MSRLKTGTDGESAGDERHKPGRSTELDRKAVTLTAVVHGREIPAVLEVDVQDKELVLSQRGVLSRVL